MNGSKQTHILQYLLVSLDNNTDGNQLFTRNEVQAKHEKLDNLQKLYLQKQITTYYTTSTSKTVTVHKHREFRSDKIHDILTADIANVANIQYVMLVITV